MTAYSRSRRLESNDSIISGRMAGKHPEAATKLIALRQAATDPKQTLHLIIQETKLFFSTGYVSGEASSS